MAGATRAVGLDISKAFDRFWNADIFQKIWSYVIFGQIYPINAGIS